MTHTHIHLISPRLQRERRQKARRAATALALAYLLGVATVAGHRSYETGYLGEALHGARLIGRECGPDKVTMYADEEDQFPACATIERKG